VGGGYPADAAYWGFREWKSHDKYREAFGWLLRDLKAGEKGERKIARGEKDKGGMATEKDKGKMAT